ncbi:hypothetical protein LR48_Vigan10g204200 [Vigna angularis]|uniref:Uncharacterized protein n=1 Tax=Phaseolus angularis TaxID=3914 RepID=A0A0L9VM72_PHAAN|nr:uncharacterized protein HKW66_Vig0149070 [Vigna angularis]KOM56150.1 hypothetical protein LR48_Vigan10g204200 [Vigna angularis]
MEKEEEDRRREAAIASTPCLRPNFKPKGVTQHQLEKFRELHKRRLQVKSKSKFKIKSKDGPNKKSHGDDLCSQDSVAQGSKVDPKESGYWNDCEGIDSRNEEAKDDMPVISAPNKRKLHWGAFGTQVRLKDIPVGFDSLVGYET